MRHGNKKAKLGLPADQRRALIRGLVTQVLRHGRIETTRARAKAIRRHVDHIITLAKNGSLHARRQARADGRRGKPRHAGAWRINGAPAHAVLGGNRAHPCSRRGRSFSCSL